MHLHQHRPRSASMAASLVAAGVVTSLLSTPAAYAAPADASSYATVFAREADEAGAPDTTVTVDPSHPTETVSPLVFGVNHRYAYNGFGSSTPRRAR